MSKEITDLLLQILNLVKLQDHNIKVLSNKLNTLISNKNFQQNQVTVEAVDASKVNISSEDTLLIEKNPSGFRRTSRPETYSGDNSFLPKNNQNHPKFPVQIPEIIVPKGEISETVSMEKKGKENKNINLVPVQQRIIDKNGKSVFLADVEIFNNKESVFKSRTNGIGKWMTTLAPGKYKILVSKRESLTKEKIDLSQNIEIDGEISPLELQPFIFEK